MTEWLVFAAALSQIFNCVMNFVFQKSLQTREIQKIRNGTNLAIGPDQITDGSAIRIATRQGREIFEAQFATRIVDRGENDISGVQRHGRDAFQRVPNFSPL